MTADFGIAAAEDRELAGKILGTAQELFISLGVKSATMDDLAAALGVSKKTVYRFIPNKAGLVRYCVSKELEASQEQMREITSGGADAVEEMLLIGAMVIEALKRFSPKAIHELKRFYPDSWLLVEEHQQDFLYGLIRNNLLKGISEGLYRPEIRVDILARIYIGKSQMILDLCTGEDTGLAATQVYLEFFSYHIRGIASQQGVERLKACAKTIKLSV